MAGLFSRVFRLGKAEAHSIVDAMEDPIKMTEQGIRDLKKDLQESMQSLAQVKGVVMRLRNDAENHKKMAISMEKKAMALLQSAKEGKVDSVEADRLASEALNRKEDSGQKALGLSKDLQSQEAMANQLQKNVDKLRSTIQRYENDLVTLRARAKTAAATRKLNEQIAKVDSGGTIAMLEKMKAKVEEDESLAKAYGDIADTGEDLDAKIDKALQGGSGNLPQSDDLAALKAKMGIS